MAKLQDLYASGLSALGYTEWPSKSRKFRTFVKPDKPNVYLGKAGSVRVGRTVAESRPLRDVQKEKLRDLANPWVKAS